VHTNLLKNKKNCKQKKIPIIIRNGVIQVSGSVIVGEWSPSDLSWETSQYLWVAECRLKIVTISAVNMNLFMSIIASNSIL